MPARTVALASALVLLAAGCALSAVGPFAARPHAALGAYAVASLAWVAAIASAPRARLSLTVILVVAVALRLAALASRLELSGDVRRYVFEGLVTVSGRSPFALAPEAPELADVRARFPVLYAGINHPDVSAVYPPLVQALGAAATLVADEPAASRAVLALRVVFGLADIGVALLLARLLRSRGQDGSACVVWAWSPLVAFESAGSGHFDSAGVACLCLALAWGPRARGLAAFACSVLAKYVALAVWPWFARGALAKRTLVLAACCAVAFAPFLWLGGAEHGLFAGLREYGFRWESASLVHRWIERAFASRYEFDESWTDPRRLARIAEVLVWLAVVARAWRTVHDPIAGARIAIGAWLVLSPTLHPWYLAWIAPFAAFGRASAWIWLMATAPAIYLSLAIEHAGVASPEPAWLWPLLALPCFALLVFDATRSRAGLSGGATSAHPSARDGARA